MRAQRVEPRNVPSTDDACRRLYGVVAALNRIEIKPQVRPSEIQEKIRAALHRSWYEPLKIAMTADGENVRLAGPVRNSHERQQAESAAWGAPGVTQVDDGLTIN